MLGAIAAGYLAATELMRFLARITGQNFIFYWPFGVTIFGICVLWNAVFGCLLAAMLFFIVVFFL